MQVLPQGGAGGGRPDAGGNQKRAFRSHGAFASATPFATHIFPLRHMASFGDISEMEVVDLARVLWTLLAKIYVGLETPDLNFTLRRGPAEYAAARHFHRYVSVIPRLTRVAGFELGSGMFINSVLPGGCGGVSAASRCRESGGSGGGAVDSSLKIAADPLRGLRRFLAPLRGVFVFWRLAHVLRTGAAFVRRPSTSRRAGFRGWSSDCVGGWWRSG
jgi:hypothetical protein